MSRDEDNPATDQLVQYAAHLGVVIRLDPQQSGLMILIKNEADRTFDRMISQYIEEVMGLRLVESTATSRPDWRQIGVILNVPTTTHQQVFGELTWRPEVARQNVSVVEPRGYLAGGIFLVGSAALVLGVFGACTPDYVYIRDRQSETAVRQDYVNCTEQQFKASNSTTECMENKGYQAVIIESPFSEPPRALPTSPQVSQ
jgi:hypothetical protein